MSNMEFNTMPWTDQPYRSGRSGWPTNGDALRYLEEQYPDLSDTTQSLGFDEQTRTAFLMFGDNLDMGGREFVLGIGYREYLGSKNPLERFWGVIGLLDRPVPEGATSGLAMALRMRKAERTLRQIAPVWMDGRYSEEVSVIAGALPQFAQLLQVTRAAMPEGGEH